MSKIQSVVKNLALVGIMLAAILASTAMAQDVRYSWVDMSYMPILPG